jgi:GT2 family glycosyltransferase
MLGAEVTIAVVPRDRFCWSARCLDRLYEVTDPPFDLVYVDGNSPRKTRDHLRAASSQHGFTLLRQPRYLPTNQARNLALAEVRTPFVVFVDNDILLSPGWLTTLLACAEDTGAWAVGPLIVEGVPGNEVIHIAGGGIELSGEPGARRIATSHKLQRVPYSDGLGLEREAYDFLEFHCILLRTDTFERIGPLDDQLLSTREHLDLSLRIKEAGGTLWLEPAARVTWLSPPPVALRDLPFYWSRWSDAWGRASLERFREAYGLEAATLEHIGAMHFRRQAVFAPLQAWTRRRLGRTAEKVVHRVIHIAEPRLNRVLVRSAPRPIHPVARGAEPVPRSGVAPELT